MQARADAARARGDSMHDFMADANGRVSVILPHGEVRAAFAELTGINVARGIGLLLKGDEERAEIRCGIAQFDVKQGKMHGATTLCSIRRMSASRDAARSDWAPRSSISRSRASRRNCGSLALRTPIEINGHLRKPSIGIDTGKTLEAGCHRDRVGDGAHTGGRDHRLRRPRPLKGRKLWCAAGQ